MAISRRGIFKTLAGLPLVPVFARPAAAAHKRVPCRIRWFNHVRGLGSVELDGGLQLMLRLDGDEKDMQKYMRPAARLELEMSQSPAWTLYGVYKDGARLPFTTRKAPSMGLS